jgi:hypothetical protein
VPSGRRSTSFLDDKRVTRSTRQLPRALLPPKIYTSFFYSLNGR